MAPATDLRARLRFSTNKDEPPRHRVYIGEGIGIYLDVTDASGAPAAATGVKFTLRRPDGLTLIYEGGEVSTDVLGSYFVEAVLEVATDWYIRGECSGPRPAADEARVYVQASLAADPGLPSPLIVTGDLNPITAPSIGVLTVVRITSLPEVTDPAGLVLVGAQGDVAKGVTWETLEAAAAAAGGSDGSAAGAAAGATAGQAAGTAAGTTAGTAAGTTAGATAGSAAGTSAGAAAGATAGDASGAAAGATAGQASGSNAGATAGTAAGATAGTAAGTTAGSAAGATAAAPFATAAALSASNAQSAASLAGSFSTLALATAAIGSFVEGQSVEVTADGANIGRYAKTAGAWVKISSLTVAGIRQYAKPVDEILSALATTNVTGVTTTPVTGTAVANRVYSIGPVTASGYLLSFHGFGVIAGTVVLKRFTRAGDVFTQVGGDIAIAVPAGLFTLTRADFGTIEVNAGEYVGFYATGVLVVTTNPSVGVFVSTSNSGNVSTYTTAGSTTSRFEVRLTFGRVTVTEARVAAAEAVVSGVSDITGHALSIGDVLGTTQQVGIRTVPVTAGNLSPGTYVLAEPVPITSFLRRVVGFGVNGGGTLIVKRFSKTGDVFTQIGTDVALTVPAGLFDVVPNAVIRFQAGEYFGFFPGNTSVIGRTATLGAGLFQSPASSNVTTFTDATADTAVSVQIRAEFQVLASAQNVPRALTAQRAFASAYNVMTSRQTIGVSGTPVAAGTLGGATYVFATPVAEAGFVSAIEGFALAAGRIVLKRFGKSGDVLTQIGVDFEVDVPAGLFLLDLADIGGIAVAVGDLLGVFGSTAGLLCRTVTAGSPYFASASGNFSVFTDAATDATARIEFRFIVGVAKITENRLALTEARQISIINALRDIVGQAGIYSPALAFLDYRGAWYDFSDRKSLYQDAAGTLPVTTDGQLIGRVVDRSGAGYDWIANSDALRPEWKVAARNSRSVSRWPGAKALRTAKSGLTQNIGKITVFCVFKDTTTTGENIVLAHRPGASSVRVYMGTPHAANRPTAIGRQPDGAASVSAYTARRTETTEYVVHEGVFDFAGGKIRSYLNGLHSIEGDASFLTAASSTDATEFISVLGGNEDGTGGFVGDICEIIEIVGDIDAETRAGVYGYLAENWNIPCQTPINYDPAGPLPTAWTWYNDPRAISVGTDHILLGGVSAGGSIMVGEYKQGVITHAVLFSRFENDDHDNPGFLQLADGTIAAFYCTHGANSAYWMNKTTNPANPMSWGAAVNIGPQFMVSGSDQFTYANPVMLSGEGNRIYLFLRAFGGLAENTLWFTTSDNQGVTWAPIKQLLMPKRPYTKVVRNGASRIDFFCNTGHPNEAANNSSYHFYYQGGSFYRSNGALIGAVANTPFNQTTDLTTIFNSTAAGYKSWVHNLIIDPVSGRPVATYATFPNPDTDHRYRQARWNGSAWLDREVCAAGAGLYEQERYYSGGVVTDPTDINTIYCSREITGVHQLFRYVSANDGATWTGTQLTFGTQQVIRPWIVPNSRKLAYFTGRYTAYTNFDTRMVVLDII